MLVRGPMVRNKANDVAKLYSHPPTAQPGESLDNLSDLEIDRRIAEVQAKIEALKQQGSQGRKAARRLLLDATPKQLEILLCPARFIIAVASRRFGKTTAGVLKIISKVVKNAPVIDATIWWVSPTYGQGRKPFRQLMRALRDAGILLKVRRSEGMLETTTGWLIYFKSADNPDNMLGEGLYLVVIDEFGILQDELWFMVIRPMLSDTHGELFAIGTPRGKRGWGFQLYVKGQDPLSVDYKSFRFTVEDAVFVPRAEIESARADMPDRLFRQEFMSEFLDDGMIFVGIRTKKRAPIPGEPEGIGADWAKKRDFTVFTAIGAHSGSIRQMERLNKIPYPQQIEFLIRFLEKRKQAGASQLYLVHDQTGVGEVINDLLMQERNRLPLCKRLQGQGDYGFQGLEFSNASKGELVEEAEGAWESDQLGWRPGELTPTENTAILEHDVFSAERTKGGRLTYNAPGGSHDDCVISVCLANRARRLLSSNRGRMTPRVTFI